MFRLALAAGSWDGWQKEPKWILKAALANHVPQEMIYRPKQGFVAPIAQKFMHPEFLAPMEMASAGKSPISPYLESKFFRKVLSKVRAGEPLPELTNYFLWTVAFVGAWLQQVDSVATEGQPFLQLVNSWRSDNLMSSPPCFVSGIDR